MIRNRILQGETLSKNERNQGRCHHAQVIHFPSPPGDEWSATAFSTARNIFANVVYLAEEECPWDSRRGDCKVLVHCGTGKACIGRDFFPYKGRIQELQFSPAGTILGIAWPHCCLLLCYIGERREDHFLTETPGTIVDRMAFFNDDLFVTASTQDMIQVWDHLYPTQSWDISHVLVINQDVPSFWSFSRLVWSKDGSTIYASSRQSFHVQTDAKPGLFLLYLHVDTGNVDTFPIPKEIHDLAISISGKWLALSLEGDSHEVDDQVWIWDIQKATKVFSIPVGKARLAWSSELLACVYWEKGLGIIKAFELSDDDPVVLEGVWSYQFEDPEPKSYNIALLPTENGVIVFGGGLEHALRVRWKVPKLGELCREALLEDPEKDTWPVEVKELVFDDQS